MTSLGTYFYDTEGNRLASENGVVPIPLFKDMIITLQGKSGEYHVVDWSFHVGQRLEEAGLRIVLRHAGERGGREDLSPPGPWACLPLVVDSPGDVRLPYETLGAWSSPSFGEPPPAPTSWRADDSYRPTRR